MKAVVIERPGEAVFREVEEPAVGPDDVLVRSRRAGVCRTDLELFAGELDPRWVRYPCIPGHEWSGVVEEVGVGSVGYTKAVWSRMVGLVRNRLVELDPIVTHRFPASEFRQAFDLLDRREGAVAKIVLEHAA